MTITPYTTGGSVDCLAPVDFARAKGKTVIVTGGSSGLGAAFVEAFAKAGSFVVNADLNKPQVTTPEPNVLFVKCDVANWDDQVQVFKRALAHSPNGGVDIVVANAAVVKDDEFFQGLGTDEPQKPNLKMIDVNVNGVIYTAKLAAHYFAQRPADVDRSLVITSSIMAYIDTFGIPSYGISKHGIRGLMCTLRRRQGMRVNLIAPWYMNTPMIGDAWKKSLTAHFKEHGTDWGQVEDAVTAVMRLATDSSINGRGLAIVPRQLHPSGHMDLGLDDFPEGTTWGDLQHIVSTVTYVDLDRPKDQ